MITAVIPVHNRGDLLECLLRSIAAQTMPFAEVIVVDNASTDNAAAIAGAHGCRIVEMGENAGFARAVNVGWRAASTDWVAILNSDVALDPAWLERLLGAVGGHSFATGKILSALDPNAIDGTYDLLSRGACAWRAGHAGPSDRFQTGRQIAIAPATAVLFRRDALERLNGFDEDFGSYLEDVDLGLRCLKAGITGVYVPGAVATHWGSATLGRWNPRVVRLVSRNQVRLIARHYDKPLFRRCLWQIMAGQFLWGLLALRHGAGIAWCAGKWEGLRGFGLRGASSPALSKFLETSEAEIRARASDTYWKWYFRLTSSSRPGRIDT